jgi:hypothetical protein
VIWVSLSTVNEVALVAPRGPLSLSAERIKRTKRAESGPAVAQKVTQSPPPRCSLPVQALVGRQFQGASLVLTPFGWWSATGPWWLP